VSAGAVQGMSGVDWLLVGVLVLSMLIGGWRGFVREALSLVIWVLAFIIADVFADGLSAALAERIASESLRYALAFGVLFVLTLVVGGLIARALRFVVDATGLTGTDRLLGSLFGAARAGVLGVLGVALLAPLFAEAEWWQRSQLIPHLLAAQDRVFELLADGIAWAARMSES